MQGKTKWLFLLVVVAHPNVLHAMREEQAKISPQAATSDQKSADAEKSRLRKIAEQILFFGMRFFIDEHTYKISKVI